MIQIDRLTVAAGTFRLHEVNLLVPAGHYGVLMGKTGCGKTTLLEAICGLRRVLKGRIALWDVDVTASVPARRGIGFVRKMARFSMR